MKREPFEYLRKGKNAGKELDLTLYQMPKF